MWFHVQNTYCYYKIVVLSVRAQSRTIITSRLNAVLGISTALDVTEKQSYSKLLLLLDLSVRAQSRIIMPSQLKLLLSAVEGLDVTEKQSDSKFLY